MVGLPVMRAAACVLLSMALTTCGGGTEATPDISGSAETASQSLSVVLALHHPPVPIGHNVMDQFGLGNGDALAELIRNHESVIGIFTGHVHTALATTYAGVPLIGAPGVVSTMRLGSKTDPIADSEAMSGLAVHTITGTTISTVFHYLDPSAL